MKLCNLLHDYGGLRESKYVGISAQESLFLYILSYHTKNRKVWSHFFWSGKTISRYFNQVLLALLKCRYVIISQSQQPQFI